MEMVVPVDGGELWAEDTGGEGTPLTFVHPGWGNSDIWPPVLAALNGYRTIRYDDRGYGRSAAPTGPFTLLGDLRAVLDHLGVLASAADTGQARRAHRRTSRLIPWIRPACP